MISTNELKKGVIIEFQGAPHVVEKVRISAPTARAGNTITKVRLRNLETRHKTDQSFRGGETFAEPNVEKRPCQLLYEQQGIYHFMDSGNYEQFALEKEALEWEVNFLKEEQEGLRVIRCDDSVLGLELPSSVTLQITETPPTIKGASATARTKPATLETGLVTRVPEHIDTGEIVSVDTRTGEFLGRAKRP
ncbi:MAG: elongation factor P [Planctomycetota bacterium]